MGIWPLSLPWKIEFGGKLSDFAYPKHWDLWPMEEMGLLKYETGESSPNHHNNQRNHTSMENLTGMLGPKRLIKKHEFVRIIVQCLHSLGYKKSASCLESESGISYMSPEAKLLEMQILNANWEDSIGMLNEIEDLTDETRASALFLVLQQCLLECLSRGDDSSALSILRKRVSPLNVDREKVHNLAVGMLSLKEMGMGKLDDSNISELRRKSLLELEKLLPPPIMLPERRLEHLVETAVTAQMDSCVYHNSHQEISLYEDHYCGRDQIPTETVQVCFFLQLIFHYLANSKTSILKSIDLLKKSCLDLETYLFI